ncbi:MAG TPA: glycosyltransferase family 2 protein, partial [Coriobacteriia bacterium]
MTSLSVVIPAKNEEDTIGHVLEELNLTIPGIRGYTVEVIVVDDGCSDRTAEIATAFGARVVRNTGPGGKGVALCAGFAAATGDFVVMLDADFSHRSEEIPAMLAEMRPGVGLVIGSRVVGGSEEYTHIRALGNVFLSAALGICTRRYLSD